MSSEEENGDLVRLAALLKNARELESADEGGLAPRSALVHRLLDIAKAMNRIHDREEMLAFLRDRLRELFDAEESIIVLFDDAGSPRVLDDAPTPLSFSGTVLARARAERRPFLVEDTRDDVELSERSSIQRLGLVSVLCAPLIVDGTLLGVIQFTHRNLRPGPFSSEDLEVLELFAEQAATALANLVLVERLERALAEIREAQNRLVTSERLAAFGSMAAGIAHGFNNVLMSVIGITDLLIGEPDLEERFKTDLMALRTNSQNGADLVRRLQQFAGHGGREEPEAPLDLRIIVENVLAAWRHLFEAEARHGIVRELSPVAPVLGRESEFADVVMNLLLNAVEAQPEGGIVRVTLSERGDLVCLSVADGGPGLTESVASRVFEPFFTTKPNGHGLGLSMCYGVVTRAGGTITVGRSEEGGAVFHVTFKRTQQVASPKAPLERAPRSDNSGRILVVDDDALVRQVTERMLKRVGYEPLVAASGDEALQILRREPVELLLTDVGMPGMDGVELARRAREGGFSGPIVLLTGWEPTDEARVGSDVVDLVLRKPIGARDLADALARVR